MNTILYEKQKHHKKAIKKDLGLTFLEIIILEQLKYLNKEKN